MHIPFIETLVGNFPGMNVLEGFAANTEILCSENDNDDKFDKEAYTMFTKDDLAIVGFTSDEEVEILKMNLQELKLILFKKLKPNNTCDIFKRRI